MVDVRNVWTSQSREAGRVFSRRGHAARPGIGGPEAGAAAASPFDDHPREGILTPLRCVAKLEGLPWRQGVRAVGGPVPGPVGKRPV